ncbi:MAG: Ada metal-binding domain-containing protein, partial [Sphingorhabdus sp.]
MRSEAELDRQGVIDIDWAFAAFYSRDRVLDGQFFGAVKTTGIYCKPSCPARRPLRDNIEFFWTSAQARAAGYRACMRCNPDDVSRDRAAVVKALTLIEQCDQKLSLAQLAKA